MTEHLSPKEPAVTTEIERKFVVDPAALVALERRGLSLESYPHTKIDQGYLANSPETGAVRIRRRGEQYFLTFKAPSTGHAAERVELETELTEEQFDTMWPGTEGRRVEKTRYELHGAGGHTIELDVFEGGHILAEVEFASTQEADAFEPPPWFGADVTADRGYGNASIAQYGFPQSAE